MFSRDEDFTYRTPRSIGDAFGPYSPQKLHVLKRKPRVAPILWTLFYGIAIAAFWYALVLARAA